MGVSNILQGLPESKLNVNELIDLTQKDFFKLGISSRASNLGNIRYLGFKYTFHRNKNKKLIVYVNLYFYIKGANANLYKNKEGRVSKGKKKKRETYMLVAKFPYSNKVKNMKRLYDVPIQIFSSDPSFKYYFAYALHKMNAVVTDDPTLVSWLGESLTKSPRQNNPNLKIQLTKHFFKFFKFIANNRPSVYMDNKYLLKKDAKIVNRK